MPVTANSIITPQAVKSNHINQSFTANTTYGSTPTNTVLLVTASSNGSRLTKLRVVPAATVTVTQAQLFRSKDTGTTKKFVRGIVAAPSGYTMAATTEPPVADFGFSDSNPMLLEAGEQLYISMGVTGTWSVEAEWMDY